MGRIKVTIDSLPEIVERVFFCNKITITGEYAILEFGDEDGYYRFNTNYHDITIEYVEEVGDE